ncbi:SH3 domain-containing protein [Armillaria nabsnona]|nr:SH3 domain-containing protein [Armillaria nabsnona]
MTLFQITTLINLHDIIHRLSPGVSSQGRLERALNEPDDRTTAPAPVQAKALWAYNLDASEPDDLSFAAGDIITIVEETNADWWLGEHNGCRALFPANYVENITTAPAPRNLPPAYVPPTGGRSVPPAPSEKKEYRPFMAAHSNANAPPPPGAGTNFVGLQQDPGQAEKKSKFGEYGNTMAHSAASGVGFGAGAAIGHGLVRAIF